MDIGQSATKLSKNPLGIIALFILLIYGLATILFGYVGNVLTENQRWWFVVFLVVFPIVVLAAFVYLVTKHHPKLYAPGEFKDEKNFFGYVSPKDREEKYMREEMEAFSGNDKVDRTKNLNSVMAIREKVEKIENNVFDYYEKHFSYDIEKNVFFNTGKKRIIFDGIAEKNGIFNMFEIKYLPHNDVPKLLLDSAVENAISVKNLMVENEKYSRYRFRLKFVFVIEKEEETLRVRKGILSMIDTEEINVTVKVLSVARLEKYIKRIYEGVTE